MNIKKTKTLFILILLSANLTFAQELKRRGLWEARISSPTNNTPGAKIVSIDANSPIEKSGLEVGDLIIKVNDILIDSPETWSEIRYDVRANNKTKILALRDHKSISAFINFKEFPKENHQGLDTFYEEIINIYGVTQRVIITKPNKSTKKLPAIVLIGGLSCSSIEAYPNRSNNWTRVIKDLVEKSNMVLLRVEKPGVGDSMGDCSKSDFLTDLDGYKSAIKLLKSKNYIDSSKIVVYGSSLGSALAPLLANEFQLAGVISDGTFFKTWFEHMLEIERRIRQMSGDSESDIVEKMNKYYIPLYYGMLIEKKSYQEVINEYPALSEFNYHSSEHMYGRSLKYYQQLQDFDLAGEWGKIKVPVRILRGTNDWIMSAFDNQMIIDVLKRNNHSNFKLYEYAGLDHWNTIHKNTKDSFDGKEGKWEDGISMKIIEWAHEIIEKTP